jgi:subtilisin family serine protease
MTAVYLESLDLEDPPIFLPPDLVDEGEVILPSTVSRPSLWHMYARYTEPIWGKKWLGQDEVIAVLDTGVNRHRDLPTPIAERSFISGQSPTDPISGHGTHVAGSSLGRNGIGWAPEAQLINVKVLSNQGSGSSQGIAAGIHFALDNGATIINMSLGGSSPFQPTQDALRRANSMGVLVFASAGNSGQRPPSNTIGWPARYLESGCSGAKQQSGQIASFSSSGREMDVVTPGQHIISASNSSTTGYRTMSGTSMSCPVGCGLWAVIQSARVRSGLPRLMGIEQWRAFWANFTIDRGAPGFDPVWGLGIPDYNKIIEFLAAGDLKWI